MLSSNNSFFSILTTLTNFWNEFGCILIPPAQTEVSSPLFHPNVFFGMLGNNKDFNIMYFQPYIFSKENRDNRYNMQSYSFLKFQVIIKSEMFLPQKVIIDSLKRINFDLENNNIKFKNEKLDGFIFRLNASGYKIYFNENIIATMYYVQNIGTNQCNDTPLIISYNLGNIALLLQKCNSIWDVKWNENILSNEIVSYGDVMLDVEKDYTNFLRSNSNEKDFLEIFNILINTAKNLLSEKIAISAYIYTLKAKYYLDIFDYKNLLTQENKIKYKKILRDMIDSCCKKYLENKNNILK